MFRDSRAPFALGRYSTCLEVVRARAGRRHLRSRRVDEVIERLGGAELMVKIRAEKTADERYPQRCCACAGCIAEIPDGPAATRSSRSFSSARCCRSGTGSSRNEAARQSAHAALDQGARVLARLHRGRRGRAAARRLADEGRQAARDRGGAPAAVRRHDAHEGSTGADPRARRAPARRRAAIVSSTRWARFLIHPGERHERTAEWKVARRRRDGSAVYEAATSGADDVRCSSARTARAATCPTARSLAAANALRARGIRRRAIQFPIQGKGIGSSRCDAEAA